MKIIVAHPGTQHSFKLAAALKKEKVLFKYMTTVYNKNNSIPMKLTKLFIKGDNLKRANSRRCNELDDSEVKQYYEILGLLELLVLRIFKNKKFYFWLRKKKTDLFGKKVAKFAIKNNVDAVIMYDTHESECFKILSKKAPNIKRIVDYSSATSAYMKKIYDEDITITGDKSLLNEVSHLCNENSIKETISSVNLTDFFIAPSEFVKKSIEYCGGQSERIFIVPYGCNIKSIDVNREHNETIIDLLYVGQVTYRKGVHHLINAFKELNNPKLRLNIVGNFDQNSMLYNENLNEKNIKFHGFLTHDKMLEIYSNASIFIMPSLSEGMSLSILEAMGCNLPIICTENSGVTNIVSENNCGFIIKVSNKEQIKEKIKWFIENRDYILSMGENSRKVAAATLKEVREAMKYTWDAYEKNIYNAIKDIVIN